MQKDVYHRSSARNVSWLQFVGSLISASVAFAALGCLDQTNPQSDVQASASAVSVCGNGVIESGETCDDHNTTPGDGCNYPSCSVESGSSCYGQGSLSCTIEPAGRCPGGSDQFINSATGRTYFFCKSFVPWASADTNCNGLGGGNKGWRLVRIDNAAENTYITNLLTLENSDGAWIGASDPDEGQWRWRDSDQFWSNTYTGKTIGGLFENWDPLEPQNVNADDYAYIADNGLWAAVTNNFADNKQFICEAPLVSCGNGSRDANEECDDHNKTVGDGCDASCYIESGYVCSNELGSTSDCNRACTGKGTQSTHNGKNYFVCENEVVRSTAQTNCEAVGDGWHMVRIDDGPTPGMPHPPGNENDFVQSLVAKDAWIGATDGNVEHEGVWLWEDGAQFWYGKTPTASPPGFAQGGLYSYWNASEPTGSETQDCAAMLYNLGTWQDITCGSSRVQVCEGPLSTCGNGVRQVGEECDDGNSDSGDGCDGACFIENGHVCFGSPSVCPIACTGNNSAEARDSTTGIEYFYCDAPTDWATAKMRCEGIGANWRLARIEGVNENAFLVSKIRVRAPTLPLYDEWWIGANNPSAQTWSWVNRTAATAFWTGGPPPSGMQVGGLWTNWRSGEPNSTGSGMPQCGVLERSDSKWIDSLCTQTRYWLCEGPVAAICGDGVASVGEACDDNNNVSGDGCTPLCAVEPGFSCTNGGGEPSTCEEVCGNGTRTASEACDDNNLVSGDGCSNICTWEFGWYCNGANLSACITICGDRMKANREGCDDDNTTNGDGCSSTCVVEPGYACPGTQPSVCGEVCGDGIKTGNQACDDHNTNNNDGCNSMCAIEFGFNCVGAGAGSCTSSCADGKKASSEACDDGNFVGGDGCTMCAVEFGFTCIGNQPSDCDSSCRDGKKASDEGCDDGDGVNGDGCSSNCVVETGFNCSGNQSACASSCGDGVKASDEGCDDGERVGGDGCSVNCNEETGFYCDEVTPTTASDCNNVCGDEIIASNEECDDGNLTNTDSCTNICKDARCGDGFIHAETESCDGGNSDPGDGCSATCLVEDTFTCNRNGDCEFFSCDLGLRVCDSSDRDGDGVPNPIEVQQGTDPGSVYSALDTDGDGHPNYVEQQAGSDFKVRASVPTDSDGDKVPDWVETRQDTSPTQKDDFQDSDSDGVADYAERGARSLGKVGCSFATNTSESDSGTALLWAMVLVSAFAARRRKFSWHFAHVRSFLSFIAIVTLVSGCLPQQENTVATETTATASAATATCGDTVVNSPSEECDDGNTTPFDGCDGNCQVENKWSCYRKSLADTESVCTNEGTLCTGLTDMQIDEDTGRSYFFCVTPGSWSTAVQNCAQLGKGKQGWHAVRIDNDTENTFVKGMLIDNGVSAAWLGASDDSLESTWRWLDSDQFWQGTYNGSSFGGLYSNWDLANGQPGNVNQDDYATITTLGNGTWIPLAATVANYRPYICEAPLITCGDGNVDPDEECDNSNKISGDGCNSACYIENGYVCQGKPQHCDLRCSGVNAHGTQVFFQGKSYFVCDNTVTRAQAQTNCTTIGAGWGLPRIDGPAPIVGQTPASSEENVFIAQLINEDAWIGATDYKDNVIANEGVWRWDDGDQFWLGGSISNGGVSVGSLYNRWYTTQPGTTTSANCATMKDSDAKWEDVSCSAGNIAVCEGPLSTCGDGVLQLGEGCDVGVRVANDGCDDACEIVSGYACVGSPSVCTIRCNAPNALSAQIRDETTGKDYFYCTAGATWSTARQRCMDIGANWDLVKIDNDNENNFLSTRTPFAPIASMTWWIGASNTPGQLEWRWTDGIPFWTGFAGASGGQVAGRYNSWGNGQPDSTGNATAQCAILSSATKTWDDTACSQTKSWLCEGPIAPICGDNIVSNVEGCDDGNSETGDGCSATCQVEPGYDCGGGTCLTVCGDGYKTNDEVCDDHNTLSGDGCNATCTATEAGFTCSGNAPTTCTAICGDGLKKGTETCDNDNLANGDGCSSSCRWEFGWYCNGASPSVCFTICGDGAKANREACDDDNTTSGDGCKNDCSATESGFTCSGTEPTTCTAVCGDGDKKSSEACDDDNTSSNDGCSSTCAIEFGYNCSGSPLSTCTSTCGDDKKASNEGCDDDNTTPGDGCSSTCTVEPGYTCPGISPSVCSGICGDGTKLAIEACDDHNLTNEDGCSSTCAVEDGYSCNGSPSTCESVCGDGELAVGKEDCDDNNLAVRDGCNAKCKIETGYACTAASPSICINDCGDSVVAIGKEDCDDGNDVEEDACLSSCKRATCGDNVTQTGVEACDFGDTESGDGCSAECLIEDEGECTGNAQCQWGSCDLFANKCDGTDSDGDGVPNAIEIQEHTNPFSLYSAKDTEGDGHPDFVEGQAGSDGHNRSSMPLDSDTDGVPDWVEELQGTRPGDARDFQDSDHDGVADYAERGARSLGKAGCSISVGQQSSSSSAFMIWLFACTLMIVTRSAKRRAHILA